MRMRRRRQRRRRGTAAGGIEPPGLIEGPYVQEACQECLNEKIRQGFLRQVVERIDNLWQT